MIKGGSTINLVTTEGTGVLVQVDKIREIRPAFTRTGRQVAEIEFYDGMIITVREHPGKILGMIYGQGK